MTPHVTIITSENPPDLLRRETLSISEQLKALQAYTSWQSCSMLQMLNIISALTTSKCYLESLAGMREESEKVSTFAVFLHPSTVMKVATHCLIATTLSSKRQSKNLSLQKLTSLQSHFSVRPNELQGDLVSSQRPAKPLLKLRRTLI